MTWTFGTGDIVLVFFIVIFA